MDDADIVIVGGGILGSAMSTVMARNGRRVIVIERDMGEVETIAGEVLMPGGSRALNILGLADVLQEIESATPLYSINQNYPEKDNSSWQFILPRPSLGFHHEKFVTALRNRAKQENNVTFIEGVVTGIYEEHGIASGVKYRKNNSNETQEIHAALTVVADGRFSKFRKQLSSKKPVSEHIVCATTFDMEPPKEAANDINYYCFEDLSCHALTYSISSSEFRFMLFAQDGTAKKMQDYISDVIASRLPEEYREPLRNGLSKFGLRTCRANYLPTGRLFVPGLLMLGDALSMRHPVTGSGMTICFEDVRRWRDLLGEIPNLYDYEKMFQAHGRFCNERKSSIFVISCLAEIYNNLYSSKDIYLQKMKLGFLNYLRLGGKCLEEPGLMVVAYLLSPYTLLKHLVGGLMFTCYQTIVSEPLWMLPKSLATAACIFVKGCGLTAKFVLQEIQSH